MTLADCAELERWSEAVAGQPDLRAELGRELTWAWVACDPPGTDAPLGYALGWWVVDELQLLSIATHPQARRRGAARRLLEALSAAARAAGGQRVSLEVARSNVPAVRLYESSGFRVFNVRKRYYPETGDDALEMELTLGRASSEE